MFNNPYDRYNPPYSRSTKYGPILPGPFLGPSQPFIPTSSPLGRRSGLANGIGRDPYGVVARRMPYQVPAIWPGYYSWHECPFGECEERCNQTQTTAHPRDINHPKTKDVVIRGKAFAVRASYLQDQPKFEKELREYLEKKDEDAIPERVINLLFAFINKEVYCNDDPYDEVTLCILAHNAGAKSVVNHSLDRLKQVETAIDIEMLVDIIITILRSSDVPGKLKDWLEQFIAVRVDWYLLCVHPAFMTKIIHQFPETFDDLLVLMKIQPKMPTPESRIL